MSVVWTDNGSLRSGDYIIEDPRSIIWREAYIIGLRKGNINPKGLADKALKDYNGIRL